MMAWVRQARWEGVMMNEPVVEPPVAAPSAQTLRIWADQQCTSVGITDARLLEGVIPADTEATRKACGVLVARLQGKSWAPPPSNDDMVNVGTGLRLPDVVLVTNTTGKACCQPLISDRGGVLVVVRGWESQPHGEGEQQVRSIGTEIPGGRR